MSESLFECPSLHITLKAVINEWWFWVKER